ncbi:hypothetical protein A2U01_0118313 [Trifolium medium]|uniref:Uncharacterized protein n=1 Tax=Trifolium medium TaxID=97028 RepID=A0A392WB26_9FABA|nr:hypothetical protein [Trifolium medium]
MKKTGEGKEEGEGIAVGSEQAMAAQKLTPSQGGKNGIS